MAADVELTPDDLDALVSAVATAFRLPADAHQLLRRIELPPEYRPNFAVDHRYAWNQVFDNLESGVIDQPYRRVITEAARRFPANSTFVRLRSQLGAIRRVLVVGASPDGEQRVRGDRELKLILQAATGMTVDPVLAATAADLAAVGDPRPDVLHLACHGDGTNLVFETGDGQVQRVDAARVVELLAAYLKADRLRAVVLNACYSAEMAERFSTVATIVIAHGGELDDDCAATFAGRLYSELRSTPSIAEAARRAAATTAATSDYCADLGRDLVVLCGD